MNFIKSLKLILNFIITVYTNPSRMRHKISALTNHISITCCYPLNLFRLNQFEVGFPLLVILLKEGFQSHSNGCYPYQVSRHISVKDLFYIQNYVGNGLVQPHMSCPTTFDLPYVFLSQTLKSKFTLYTTHVYHMHYGFTTTVQGMAYYGRGHDNLSKPQPIGFLVCYHYNQCF